MRRFGALVIAAVVGVALISSGPALAFRAGQGRGGGWHGAGWHGAGWHGGGWGGSGWGGGGWGYGLAGLGLGAGLAGLAGGSDYGYPYDYAYGYPGYGYSGYGYGYAPGTAAVTAPLVTGRSVAVDAYGNYCTTPVKTCLLYHSAYLGDGCSCRVPGGHARGSVLQ
jgi:hypothetical protein